MYSSKVLNSDKYRNIFVKALALSESYDICSFLHSNNITSDKYSKYDWLLALGNVRNINSNGLNNNKYLNKINNFILETNKDWIFTTIAYDFKNGIEDLTSKNTDNLNFEDFTFYIPKFVITSKDSKIELFSHEFISKNDVLELELKLQSTDINTINNHNIKKFKHRVSEKEYIETIENIRSDIKYGDIYEINYCQEFYVENAQIEKPWQIYLKMCDKSPAPFSAYYKYNDKHLISASPERYIQKNDNTIISQPIKGTSKRRNNTIEDKEAITALQNSVKERAENIMIVDLVRNDLSRIPNSKNTKVEELCGIYSFKHVHQMISTISADLDDNTSFTDILKATFPMGSMTGAPKVSSMNLIEKYEKTKRGLFSGSVGYINPDGDFDFNVIIRSLLYNSKNNYLSLSTGGAITYLCNAEDEYQESLLKAEAVFRLF